MSRDEKSLPPENHPPFDPKLEARIVAWVLGETSAAEAAELARIANKRPEVAAFKRNLAATHNLVAQATQPEAEPLRLSAERRAKLLATLGAKSTEETPSPIRLTALQRTRRAQRWVMGIAACAAVGFFVFVEVGDGLGTTTVLQLERYNHGGTGATWNGRDDAQEASSKRRTKEARYVDTGAARASLDLKDKEAMVKKEASVLVWGAPNEAPRSITTGELFSRPAGGSVVGLSYFPPNLAIGAAPGGSTFVTDHLRGDIIDTGIGGVLKTGNAAAMGSGTVTLGAAKENSEGSVRLSIPKSQAYTGSEIPTINGSISSGAINASGGLIASTIPPAGDNEFKGSRLTQAGTANSPALGQYLMSRFGAVIEESKAEKDLFKAEADADRPLAKQAPAAPPAPTETSTAKEAVSTFSLHVSDVSFRLAQGALGRGELPEPGSVRAEEFYNAFDYGDPTPTEAEKVGCRIEQSAHPFLAGRNLMRIAMKVAASGRGASTPLRLTVLVDTSGSMEREDRAATVRSAMSALVSLLGPNDRVTLLGFARQPRLLAEDLPGDRAKELLDLLARTPAEGGTNFEEALKLAGEQAVKHFRADAHNRIVVLTDGAANLGNAIPEQLAARIEELRQRHIAFDACGVGLDGLDDAMLEALARKGDGRYYVLNSPADADAGFARKLAGAFKPAAENVKVQVRFNPARVATYRLVGFDQHRLNEADFRNDKVDAAELAADEAGVALYQFEPLPQGEGEIGEVFVRFRDPATGAMVERSWTIPYEERAVAFARTTPSLQLAGISALLAEKLRGGALAAEIQLRDFSGVVSGLQTTHRHQPRVAQLAAMFEQARRLIRE